MEGNGSNEDVFDINRWIRVMDKISEDPSKISIMDFFRYQSDLMNLFKNFGAAISAAFSGMNRTIFY